MHQPSKESKSRSSARATSLLIRITTALIVVVVANQWHLASHYVQDLHRNDARYFDVSFATFLGEDPAATGSKDRPTKSDTISKLEDDYVTSPICGPCFSFRGSMGDSRQTCYDVLQRYS
jgi:hypothetical protein